jgi:hypothetical protein
MLCILDAFAVVYPIDILQTLNIMSDNNKMQPGALSQLCNHSSYIFT